MNGFGQEIAKQVVDQTVGNIYSDVIQPTAKSVGNTLSLIPRTVGVWLGKWEKWIINGEKSIELTRQAVQERVAKIPEEKLSEPEPNIAIPAIQQLSYCYDCEELRNMYANLLVTSMNVDTKSSAPPAFVDIIKQLTPDEAKLIKSLDYSYQFYPLIDIVAEKANHSFRYLLKNFTVRKVAELEYPESISTYIENLARLKIIEIHNSTKVFKMHNSDYLSRQPYLDLLKSIIVNQLQKYEFQTSHPSFSISCMMYPMPRTVLITVSPNLARRWRT